MKRNGMTAVEVLVAIICIGVIAAIVLPVYGGSHRPAYKTSCLSNLKQVGLALLIYGADEDDYYPQNSRGEPDWITRVHPYAKTYAIFHCSIDETAAANSDQDRSNVSYSLNGSAVKGLKQTSLAKPEAWILLAERNNETQPGTGPWTFNWWNWRSEGDVRQELAVGRHKGTANYGYGDGHVKNLKPEQLLAEGLTKPFEPKLKPAKK